MECSQLRIVKRKPSRKEGVEKNKNRADKNRSKPGQGIPGNYLVADFHKFEEDKDEELKKASTNIQLIDDEIKDITIKIRNIQQVNKCMEVDRALHQLNDKLDQLSCDKHTQILKLLYFPYAIEPNVNDSQSKKDTIRVRQNLFKTNFVNLTICSRSSKASDPFKLGHNNDDSLSKDFIASTLNTDTNHKGAISLDKMIRYNRMFAKVSKYIQNSSDDVVPNDSYDFDIEDFGLELNDVEEPKEHNVSSEQKIIHKVQDNSDALELLSKLHFNTKDLLRAELKAKSYFHFLCTLSDQYKRFHVLIETLKHKINILNKIGECKLHLVSEVQGELLENSKNLINKMNTLEKLYRNLFQVTGLKDIEATIVLPRQLKPYEKCYRFIETTELKKYINLLAQQTQYMENLLQERGMDNNHRIDGLKKIKGKQQLKTRKNNAGR